MCSSRFDNLLFRLVPRPQEPKTRSYEIREIEFINPRDGTLLAGELTYPISGTNFPAFVLISGHEDGAPPADRNYEITGHKYFFVISDLLTKRGFAVLRFDNRGTGKSTGNYTAATDEEFASDAASALQWLRNKADLRLTSSGYLGHSQGGIKALIAANFERPDYIVALAGLGVETPIDFFIRQNQHINAAQGLKQEKIDKIKQEIRDMLEIILASNNVDEVRVKMREYAESLGVINEKQIQKLIEHFATNWWFAEVRRDFPDLIKSYEGPVLALFGSNDLLVSAAIDEEPVRKLLSHPKSETYTFEGLNHLFQTAKKKTGPYEYWEIENTIEDSVVEKVALWTRKIIN